MPLVQRSIFHVGFLRTKGANIQSKIRLTSNANTIETTTYGKHPLEHSVQFNSIKSSPSTTGFKRLIKRWQGENCTCKICL